MTANSAHKHALLALVADLHAARYCASDIARALDRSPERIRQILQDLRLTDPKLRTLNDLPNDLRQRVIAFRDLKNATES